MKRWIAGVALATGLLVAGAASAADLYVFRIDDRELSMLDMTSVVRTGNYAKAAEIGARTDDNIYTATIWEYDCGRSQIRMLANASFRRENHTLISDSKRSTEWVLAAKGTYGEIMLKAACDTSTVNKEDLYNGEYTDLVNAYFAKYGR
jgi:hypothetical protein